MSGPRFPELEDEYEVEFLPEPPVLCREDVHPEHPTETYFRDESAKAIGRAKRARELGAEVITTSDEELARGLLRVARERNVTQIVLGKPAGGGLISWLRSGRLVRRLMQESGDIDLHVIKGEKALTAGNRWQVSRRNTRDEFSHPVCG